MHEITKMRLDVVRRQLRVASKAYITPRMLRIVFTSSELDGFHSPSPDDHIKIFLPTPEGAAPVMRDFTPRAWDLAAGTLTLEFALHQKGPAAEWAITSQVGDMLAIGGPRGSTVVSDDFDWYLLAGDAAALPSFARRLEGLRAGVPVHVIALVADSTEIQEFATRAAAKVQWVTARGSLAQDTLLLRSALASLSLPDGPGFVWIATETSTAHDLYEYMVQVRKQPKEWIKAAGYWTADAANAS